MRHAWSLSFLASVCLLMVMPDVCDAQRAVQGKEASFIRIQDLTGLAKRDVVKTPVYTSSSNKGVKQERDWGEFLVTYEISQNAPEWIDDLVFQYYVMSVKTDANRQRVYSLFTKTVKYSDIHNEPGRRMLHKSAVYLRPQAMERFGALEAVAVEVIYDGKVIAVKSDKAKDCKLPDGEWWKNDIVIKNEKVQNRDGYLLNRDESPFAYLNIDDYELIR